MKLKRFGVSSDKELLEKFDTLIRRKGYNNRSEAFRDLMREVLVKTEWTSDKNVAGSISIVYNHNKRELVNKLVDIQHNFQKTIISTQHIHLDHDNCLEIIAVKGKSIGVQKLADRLRAIKGVKHGALSMLTTGKEIT